MQAFFGEGRKGMEDVMMDVGMQRWGKEGLEEPLTP